MTDPLLPESGLILDRDRNSEDVFSIAVKTPENFGEFSAGQFNMLYVPGAGEVAISISGDPGDTSRIVHTIRAVGSVTRLLAKTGVGEKIGIRGPYGTGWPVDASRNRDLVLVAGGIGIAPLRPVLYQVLANRDVYDNVSVLYGARSPDDILFAEQLLKWKNRGLIDLFVSVDTSREGWWGDVGVVTDFIHRAKFEPDNAVAMVCGPEIMIRFSVNRLRDRGMTRQQVYVSLERNMKCAVGFCGHCQLGPHFICKNGPVFTYDTVERFLMTQDF